MHVIVVESPAKAKTVRGYLGPGYQVFATRGHVRDLPKRDGAVDPARGFAMVYATTRGAGPALGAIRAALKDADSLVLATDPDREGEAIAWQVLSWLQEKGALGDTPVRRAVFHEVTAEAVRAAIGSPREIDMDLVRAQQARRALDHLVGFHLSALLWRKVRGGRSAGRVQSVALRLVCAREAEIEAFEPREYWTVDAAVTAESGGFTARLTALDGTELDCLALDAQAMAEDAARRVREGVFHVAAVERAEVRRNPVPPFTTASLQQEASRRLGFGVRETMRIAQALYEGVLLDGTATGLVTYVRTDGTALSKGAARAARGIVRARFGRAYLPGSPGRVRTASRHRREAHEAIRPTDLARTPEDIEDRIGRDEAALYGLIWQRTVASQMAAARVERVRVELAAEDGDVVLSASGSHVLFDGFLRLYREGSDEDEGAGGDLETGRALPAMAEGERVFVTEVAPERRHTRPPPRYTEASLVRRLEELGIGRPSTYAAIVGVLRERGYAVLYRRRFVPTERGRVVIAFLETYFADWVACDFTTGMEADLDRVAEGALAYEGVLDAFWGPFQEALAATAGRKREDVRAAVEQALGHFIFAGPDGRTCPACADGELRLKLGRYGPFVGCSSYPACEYSRPLAADPGDTGGDSGPVALGADPDTGLALTLRRGRYGRYVQRGGDGDAEGARGTVPGGMDTEEITPEVARALLALPRTVGVHPDTGRTILAGIGLYGSWLKHGANYVPLPDDEDVLAVGLNRAVALVDARRG